MQKKGMEQEGLVKSGDVVLAGVSGGADSACLLLMLLSDVVVFILNHIHLPKLFIPNQKKNILTLLNKKES